MITSRIMVIQEGEVSLYSVYSIHVWIYQSGDDFLVSPPDHKGLVTQTLVVCGGAIRNSSVVDITAKSLYCVSTDPCGLGARLIIIFYYYYYQALQ